MERDEFQENLYHIFPELTDMLKKYAKQKLFFLTGKLESDVSNILELTFIINNANLK